MDGEGFAVAVLAGGVGKWIMRNGQRVKKPGV